MIDFIGCLEIKGHMRPVVVEPFDEEQQFPSEVSTPEWYGDDTSALIFHGPDESLDDGNASMFTNWSRICQMLGPR